MMEDGYFRTQMTLFANISALEQGFGLQCSYSPEKAAFGVFFRPIATMRSVRIPKVGYDASKGHLSPIDASGCANVIEESVVFLGDSGGDKSRGFLMMEEANEVSGFADGGNERRLGDDDGAKK
ncbi:hypothetical protein MKY14_10725 [Paenibacillus sp. FSL R5-0887]|jgi:hypothetical protein|uniref:hypothetical protein n=1 Tax=Paenibacillus sp. FSL R5-0887 TaxID=2921662 RepID=UPI0030F82CBD